MKRFDAEEVARVSLRPEVTSLKVVPAMIPQLIQQGGKLGVSTIIYGASPIAPPVLEAALDHFGPILIQIYGQSEAPATVTCLAKTDHLGTGDHRFSAGRAFRSVAVEVRSPDGSILKPGEVGEVTVQGSHVMTRYHRLPKQTSKVLRNGWIWTKDMAVVDERGYVHLLGRGDEIIISGGFNISPREVERAILEFAPVADCAVIGLRDEKWGSAVAAVVTTRPGSEITPQQVVDAVKDRLGYRVPRVVAVVESIPRNSYGKVDRGHLLRLLGTGKK